MKPVNVFIALVCAIGIGGVAAAEDQPQNSVEAASANQSETHSIGIVDSYNPVLKKVQIDGVMYTITEKTRKGYVVAWPGPIFEEGELDLNEGLEVIFRYQKAPNRPLDDIFGVMK